MTPSERAAARCSFDLTHQRAKTSREFSPGHITGENIDDAFDPEAEFCGTWMDDPELPAGMEDTEANWIAWYGQYALQESIHEMLEWFQVDGKPWLNPHPIEEKLALQPIVIRLWRELCELQQQQAPRLAKEKAEHEAWIKEQG
jgi:hypothetical protein